MNKKILSLIFIILFGITISTENTLVTQAITFDDVNVVVFTASGQVYNEYFGIRNNLEKWGATVTVAAYTETVVSAGAPTITTDILIPDIANITDYDVIFIPGGGIVDTLTANQITFDLLNEANDAGIVIAGVCAGTMVMSEAGLIDGKNFTTWPGIVEDLEAAGGIYVEGEIVVTDGNIITASPEGMFSLEISYHIATALGYRFDFEANYELLEKDDGVKITLDISDKLIFCNVTVDFYLKENNETFILKDTIIASLDDNSEYYEVIGEDLEAGDYTINVTIMDVFDRVTTYENALEFNIPNSSQGLPSLEIGFTLFALLLMTSIYKKRKILF